MKRNLLLSLITLFLSTLSVFAQSDTKSEEELKEKGNSLFESGNFKEAKPIYAQLLSLYSKDPNYNYKYGACVLVTEADKEKPMKYLNFAISKGSVDPLAYYYLAKAHHLNYDFAKAVKFYSRFKTKAKAEERTKYQVDRKIEMCKNGNKLLSKLNEVQVIERQVIAEEDFYRIYKTDDLNGKLIAKPEDFKTKYDKKKGEESIIFLPNNANEVYFSSYGKKGTNGKDIFKAIRLGNGEWSEAVNLGTSINTPFDEDFAFIHPDGKTLYFASKGHTSMGGYDIFKSTLDDATGLWTAPENLDFAFSSADDDIMFVTDKAGVLAYFASNRSSEIGKYTVYKVLTERQPVQLSVIEGRFIAENNPDNKKAKVTIIDQETKETIGVYETDKDGRYTIEIAKNGGDYQFNIETTDDAPIHTGVVKIPKQDEFEILGQELRLVGTGEDQQLVIKNIFDGTADNQLSSGGPKVSSGILRMKANLDVNYTLNNLAALQKEKEEANEQEQVKGEGESNQQAENEQENLASNETNSNVTSSSNGNQENQGDGGNENTLSDNSQSGSEAIVTDNSSSGSSSAENILNGLEALKTSSDEQMNAKVAAVNAQYTKGKALQEQASQVFEEVEQLKTSGASSDEVKAKQKEAGILALKAAYASQIAQQIEESVSGDLSNIGKIQSAEEIIRTNTEANNLAEAELGLNNLKQSLINPSTVEEIVQVELEGINESERVNQKKIKDYSAKKESFESERAEIDKLIAELDEELFKASKSKQEELQKNKEALELDREDINYQEELMVKDIKKTQYSQKSLAIEKAELLAVSSEIKEENTSDASTVGTGEVLSEEEKNDLIATLKAYRDDDVIAYTATNELYADELPEVPQLTSTNGASSSKTSNNELINSVAELNDASGNNTIDNPTGSLDRTSGGSGVSAEGESIQVDQEENFKLLYGDKVVAEINKEFEAKVLVNAEQEDKELSLANDIQTYEDWGKALAVKKQQAQTSYDQEIDEAERTNLNKNITELTQLMGEKRALKEAAQQELTDRASGNFKPEATAIADVSEINVKTIVEDNFTNFKFDQAYEPTNPNATEQFVEGKKALFEASLIAKQEEQARDDAYNLPTAEERREAFSRVNTLKKQSEQKQLEAAQKFADFNLQEFRINQQRIKNANRFKEDEFESGSLDLAELLEEEAEVYFTDAAQIRASIKADDRLSQKEVALQKAYDYEMLALKKQKEALIKLNLVVSEVVNQSIQAKLNPSSRAKAAQALAAQAGFVQTITDAEVLAITDAEEAKTKADKISEEIVSLTIELKTKEEELASMSEETSKDSLTALVNPLKEEIDRKTLLAAQYYEREDQVSKGLVGVKSNEANPSDIVLQAKKAAISTYNVDLDTINVDDERKNLILASQGFIEFSKNREELGLRVQEANTAYNEATSLVEENNRLKKEAIVERNKSKVTREATEKARLIKAATILEQRIDKNEKSIDSLNKVIKVKNFLVVTLEKKDNDLLEKLPEEEQLAYQSLTKEYIPQELVTEKAKKPILAVKEEAFTTELTSTETSGQTTPLNSLEQENTSLSEEATVDESTTPEGNLASATPTGSSSIERTDTEPVSSVEKVEESIPEKEEAKPVEYVVENKVIENIDVVPRQIKEAIFVTLNKKESVYNDKKPIPAKTNLPTGVVYKVQVGAFRNPIPQDLFKGFAPMMSEKTASGITRYTAGLFAKEATAIGARNEIRKLGYPDAFVVAFLNGERIGIARARQISGGGTPVSSSSSETTSVEGRTYNSTSTPSSGGTSYTAYNEAEINSVGNILIRENVKVVRGGSKEALSSSFNNPTVEEVVNTRTVEGVYYTVQIGVFSAPVKKGTFNYKDLNVVELPNGLIRYNAGIFESAIAAADLKNNIQSLIKDAFITAYYNGKRVSLNEASRLKNK